MSPTRVKVSDRRVDRAARFVTDHWMPVSPTSVEFIQQRNKAGVYDSNLKALLSDLQQDANLFLYCVKELAASVTKDGATSVRSPFEVLERAGLDELRAVLASASTAEISSHSLRSARELQIQRVQETCVSVAAAQALCAEDQIDESVAFAYATMRQLGLSLICWNYPGLYERIAANLKSTETLDQKLTEELGFSPQSLAVSVLSRWGINSPAVVSDDESFEPAVEDAISQVVLSHCKVGETLSRANNPKLYPTAKADLKEAMIVIEAHLGKQGIEKIKERFSVLANHTVEALPQLFKGGMVLDPEIRISIWNAERVVDLNPLISRCRPFLRDRLMELYERIIPGEADPELCREVTTELLPLAGFQRGVVFGLDPLSGNLIAHLALLEGTLCEPGSAENDQELAQRAFEDPTVIIELEKELSSYKLGMHLGISHRVGVLQVNLPALAYKDSPEMHQHHLRTLALAMTHCLGVS